MRFYYGKEIVQTTTTLVVGLYKSKCGRKIPWAVMPVRVRLPSEVLIINSTTMWKCHYIYKSQLPATAYWLNPTATRGEAIAFFGLNKDEVECYQLTFIPKI
jgi:hypothetical protein